MAKLTKKLAKDAEEKKDEMPEFGVCPPGIYLCRLRSVDTSRSGPAGPYWTWEYETVGVKEEPSGKRFWNNTSLSEKAIGMVGKAFEALGFTADSDTDEAIGELVACEVKIGTVNAGQNIGQQRNEVVATHPAETHPWYEEWVEANPSGGSAPASSAADLD